MGGPSTWLSGDRINAAEALNAGLVSRVLFSEDLVTAAVALAERIGSAAPVPVRLIKQHLRQTWEQDLEGVLALETEGSIACLHSQDLAEGLTAFNEGDLPGRSSTHQDHFHAWRDTPGASDIRARRRAGATVAAWGRCPAAARRSPR